MALTPFTQAALARQESGTQVLHTVELRHLALPNGVLRLVGYHIGVDITLEADAPLNAGESVTFGPMGLTAFNAAKNKSPARQTDIAYDMVSGYLRPYMAQVRAAGGIVSVTRRNVVYHTPTDGVIEVMEPEHGELGGTVIKAGAMLHKIVQPNAANKKFPSMRHPVK